MLADDLGIEPSTELKDLERQILRQDPGLQRAGCARRSERLPVGGPEALRLEEAGQPGCLR
jgi:DNA-binding SARP family transcriptional activator